MVCTSSAISYRPFSSALWLAVHIWFFLISPLFALCLIYYLLFYTSFWWVVLLYVLWIYHDREIPRRGSRHCRAFQTMPIWRIAAEYFPLKLVKTAELDPSRNYILGCHPHGIMSLGHQLCFATNAVGCYEKFPGIKMHGSTLYSNFIVPFRREYFLALGAIDVSAGSLEHVLSRPDGGNAAGIVIGGAQEALTTQPGSYTLVLRKRKGFVRIALKTGADLVPIIAFGENEVFLQVDNSKGTVLRTMQEKMKQFVGFTLPLFYGFGIMPLRKPITVVVGKPILVERVQNPTDSQVDSLHGKYIDHVVNLFNEHKAQYATDSHLHII